MPFDENSEKHVGTLLVESAEDELPERSFLEQIAEAEKFRAHAHPPFGINLVPFKVSAPKELPIETAYTRDGVKVWVVWRVSPKV